MQTFRKFYLRLKARIHQSQSGSVLLSDIFCPFSLIEGIFIWVVSREKGLDLLGEVDLPSVLL